MDVAALAASLVTMQAGATQQAVATRMLKMNLNAQADAVNVLLGTPAATSSANLATGVGGKLDMSV
ncbi:hypothetical protein X566_05345 [Afipia sp. P52-10]|jgi:hypothetical protein|uniref:putative motility protein n=1 Tax=Afipia sp. P52-10 TaxID=1429916 RepID=UPI0003DF154A|nr:putative motility protein [Afipia sp. P52-10]ETR77112.1 hypothetical protein X566_05345 [Afipia sp. P52-10]